MALFKKKEAEQAPPTAFEEHDTSVGTAADVEAVMKKYDRESNTRVWEGMPKLVIRWLMVAFSLYCIIDTVFLSTMQEIRLPVFVGLILLFGFLTFPARKGDTRVNHMPWYDIILLIIGPGAYFFYAVNAQNVIQMSARVMQNDLYMVIGLIGILALVELCRRCVGLPILCVAGALLVYTFFNLMGTPSADQVKMTIYQVIRTMFYTTTASSADLSACAPSSSWCSSSSAPSWSGRASPSSSSAWPTLWPAPPPAAPPRWPSSPPPCAAWCPAPPWATPSPPAPSPSP